MHYSGINKVTFSGAFKNVSIGISDRLEMVEILVKAGSPVVTQEGNSLKIVGAGWAQSMNVVQVVGGGATVGNMVGIDLSGGNRATVPSTPTADVEITLPPSFAEFLFSGSLNGLMIITAS